MPLRELATGTSIHSQSPGLYLIWHIVHIVVAALPVFVTTLIGRDLTLPVICVVTALFLGQKAVQLVFEKTSLTDILEDGAYLMIGFCIGSSWSGNMMMIALVALTIGTFMRMKSYRHYDGISDQL